MDATESNVRLKKQHHCSHSLLSVCTQTRMVVGNHGNRSGYYFHAKERTQVPLLSNRVTNILCMYIVHITLQSQCALRDNNVTLEEENKLFI